MNFIRQRFGVDRQVYAESMGVDLSRLIRWNPGRVQ